MRLPALVVCTSLAAAGCGSEDRQATPEPAAKAAASPAASPSPEPAAEKVTVEIEGFTYSPETVTVTAGSRVTWIDRDKSNHTVTFAKAGPKDIGNIRPGQSRAVAFDRPGTYSYVCAYHPGMAGSVTVR